MADQVTLLDFWASPFATRVRIALALKGIEYESKEEELDEAQRSPILIEMNPVKKQVPVLIHNGKPICESLVIVQYIDEVWSHFTFWSFPDGPCQVLGRLRRQKGVFYWLCFGTSTTELYSDFNWAP